MKIIYSQPFFEVDRYIKNLKINMVELEKRIELYPEEIITPKYRFKLEEVIDISYKKLSTSHCLLYLHTNQGVMTYNLKSPPDHFVKEYKKLKNI